MAQSKYSISNTAKSLECSICLSEFTKPKLLPCLHKFCMKCLKNYCEQVDEEEKPCPLCRREFIVPEGGVEMLHDYDLTTRFENIRAGTPEISTCEICQSGDAEFFCMDCVQRLCSTCRLSHSRINSTKGHKIIDIQEKPTAKEVNKMKSQCCGIHPDKRVDLYCCECRKLLCYKCHATEHFKHECKDTSEVAKAKCQILENDEKRIESCIDEKLLNLKAASKAYIQEKSKAKTLIKTSYSELIDHLSKQKSKLLQTLDKIDVTEDILMPSDNDLRQLHCTELNSFLANSRKLMDGGTDCEIIEASDELHSRAIQLIKSEEDSIKNYPKNINLRILEHLTLNIKQLKSVMKRTDLVRTLAISKPTSHALDLEKPITGITVLDDKIFLVIFEQTQVKFYDSRDLSAKTPIDIPNMKDPRGLASCSQDKTLFISDNKLQCIHSVNITSKRVKSWKVDYRNPRGLAMTLEHNLLVTICDLQSRILEYTRDGKLIREVALDRSIQEGYQTVQFSDDQFLTCHGEVYSPHRICVIDTKGRIIKSYGKDKGGGEGQLHVPRSVAIDNNTGLLFVADNVNNRVLMFDKHLTLIGQVQTPADLLNPSRLYFDSASARLFVGDAKRRLIILSAACE